MQITGKDLLRRLAKLGCVVTAGKGSHFTVTCGSCHATVAVHAGETIAVGTLKKIERDLTPCLGKGWLKK